MKGGRSPSEVSGESVNFRWGLWGRAVSPPTKMTDPIADLLTRIRNAQTARHDALKLPYSKIKLGLVKVLCEEGFIASFGVVEEEGLKKINVVLKYSRDRLPIVSEITRISRPGRRVYVGYESLRPVRNGMGVVILSTPKGVLTDKKAKEAKVGGELLCTVW